MNSNTIQNTRTDHCLFSQFGFLPSFQTTEDYLQYIVDSKNTKVRFSNVLKALKEARKKFEHECKTYWNPGDINFHDFMFVMDYNITKTYLVKYKKWNNTIPHIYITERLALDKS